MSEPSITKQAALDIISSGAPATATETAQARRIASLEAHIRRLIIVAASRTSVRSGDDAGAHMEAELCSILTRPLPAWAASDEAVELPANLALWPEATP